MRIVDDDWPVGKGWGIIVETGFDYREGRVVTPHGIVTVLARKAGRHRRAYTTLDYVHAGRLYRRVFRGKCYTHRGIVTKAKQFAREIAERG